MTNIITGYTAGTEYAELADGLEHELNKIGEPLHKEPYPNSGNHTINTLKKPEIIKQAWYKVNRIKGPIIWLDAEIRFGEVPLSRIEDEFEQLLRLSNEFDAVMECRDDQPEFQKWITGIMVLSTSAYSFLHEWIYECQDLIQKIESDEPFDHASVTDQLAFHNALERTEPDIYKLPDGYNYRGNFDPVMPFSHTPASRELKEVVNE